MKRKNRNQKTLALSATTKRFTSARTGMGLLLSAVLLAGSVNSASATEIIKSYDYQSSAAQLQGYVISPVNTTAIDEGTVAAGNYNAGTGVHFQAMDKDGTVMASTIYKFPEEQDVRVVSIATYEAHRFVITVQARRMNQYNHVISIMVDDNGNVMNQYDFIAPSTYGKEIYPMHSVIMQDQLYICGYVSIGADFPNDPRYTDSRTAFVGKIDLNTNVSDVHYYSSTQNLNTVTNPSWNNLYNDYDAAMRLRNFDTRLFVMGSANGSATLSGSSNTINASKAWVSEIDPATLAPISTGYYGSSTVANTTTPSTLNGSYALDVNRDNLNNAFYALSNDLSANTWRITHLSNSLAISVPGSGSNSVAYTTTASIKGSGIYPWNSSSNRFTLFGMVGSDVPLVNTSAYGSTIESPTGGAIPFVMGLDLSYSSSGIAYASAKGNVLGNQLSYASGLGYQEPHWTNGTMGEWCNPAFGMQSEPFGGTDDMILMGHYLNATSARVNPRFLSTTGEGYVQTCPSAERMTYGLGLVNLQSATVTATNEDGVTRRLDYPVDMNLFDLDAEYECEATNIYRTAKPGATAMAEVSDAKGIYPNPATDQVTIQLGKEVKADATVKVILTDITGRVVLTQEGNANGTLLQLALPKLTAGMYQASVAVQGGKPEVYKLVIR